MVKIDELEIYNLSIQLGDDIWNMVAKWDYFSKDTIGKQLVRSADSISANISEGFGRYFYKENKLFCYYSRGSILETQTWLTKAYNRKLIAEEEFKKQFPHLN
jgi:four helix bundle protein